MRCLRTARISLIAVSIFFLATGAFVPVYSADAPLDEKPDKYESKFYAREYLSETDALNLQKKSSDDRVTADAITLEKSEIESIRDNQRVGIFSNEFTVFKLRETGNDQPYRYVIKLRQPGQHEFMDLMYGVNPDGSIHRIDLMVYREPYGGEVKSRRFMRQFEDRTLKSSEFRVNVDVIHIAGATISAKSVSRGARKVLAILKIKDYIS